MLFRSGKGYEKVSVEEAKEIIKRHSLGQNNNFFSTWKNKITEKITGVPISLTDETYSSEKLELGKKKKIEYIVCNDSVIFMLPGVRDGDFELRLNKEKGLILVDFSEKNSFPNCLGYVGLYIFDVSTEITNRIQGGRVSLDTHGLLSIGLERVEI